MSKIKDHDGVVNVNITLIGDKCVGKSTLLLKYVEDIFFEEYIPTIGTDFKIKNVEYDNIKFKLKLLDYVSHDHHDSTCKSVISNSNIILLLFDLSNKLTFENLKNYWLPKIINNNEINNKLIIILVGTKSDIKSHEIESNDISNFCNNNNNNNLINSYFEISSKLGLGIDQLFSTISLKFYQNQKIEKEELKIENNDKNKNKNKKGFFSNFF